MRLSLPAPVAPLVIAASMTLAYNQPLWRAIWDLHPDSSGVLLIGNVALVLTAMLTIVLQVCNSRWLLKPITIALLLAAALASFAIGAQGVLIDQDMARNILATDAREIKAYVSGAFALHLLLCWLLPAALLLAVQISRTGTAAEFRRAVAVAIGVLVVALAGAALNAKSVLLVAREHRELRYYMVPTYPLYAFALHAAERAQTKSGPTRRIATDATRSLADTRRPLVMVLVVGETARSMSFALNGYARPTNPLLAQQHVVSFTQVSSCGTSTAISVPCMFSQHGRGDFNVDAAANEENLLDVLQRVNVAVSWIDNNSGCKGVCDRVPTLNVDNASGGADSTAPADAPCPATGCYDSSLVHALRNTLQNSTAPRDRLIVLHSRGSHGPDYANRVPPQFKRFLPECGERDVASCSRQQIVNAYDNTIVYTDHILATMITDLQVHAQRFDVLLLYVSDHGESLGEHGVYLHGFPYRIAPKEQTQVPLIVWANEGFYARRGLSFTCLQGARDKPLTHDTLFHTVLSVFDVQTTSIDAAFDLFAPCRSEPDADQNPPGDQV